MRGTFAALVAAVLCGCGSEPDFVTVDGTMLGTTLHVVADVQGTSPQELYAAVMALDREAKASMSIFDPASLLSRLNRNQTDSVDRHIAFNLRLADSISSLSDGRYDVTVKPLVEAWGFAGKEAQENPERRFDPCVRGPSKGAHRKRPPDKGRSPCAAGFQFDRQRIYRRPARAARRVVRCPELHRRHRRRSPLQGRQPAGDPWRIGIETPFDGNMSNGEYLQRRIGMTEGGLATSGNYRRFYLDAKGNKIAHTIDFARGAKRRFAPAVGDGRGSDLRRGRRPGNHVPGDGGRRCAGRGEVHAPDESLFHPRRRRGWL